MLFSRSLLVLFRLDDLLQGANMLDSPQFKMFVGLIVAIAVVLNWLPDLDVAASEYLDQSLTDSLLIYASARGLNAIISVIQSFHFSFNLGVSAGANPGELLDPLNDLVERFSSFILYGLAAIGLQKLVLTATISVPMKIAVTIVLTTAYIAWLFKDWMAGLPTQILIKTATLILAVRFFIMVEVGTVAALDHLYFDARNGL
jgi:hypothetical protein